VRRAETIGRLLVSAAFPRTRFRRETRPRPPRPQAEGEAWSGSWLFEEQPTLIEAGFDVAFECPAATPMILQPNIHPSRDADLLTPDRIASDPLLPMRSYLDLFGNRVTRVEVPAGLVTFSDRFVIQDSGEPDETPPDVRTTPIADLPDDALLFLVSSRYCDSGKLADFAWSQFGKLSGGARCVQAICDFVHAKMRTSRSSDVAATEGDPSRLCEGSFSDSLQSDRAGDQGQTDLVAGLVVQW
jgi:hypothetical protein